MSGVFGFLWITILTVAGGSLGGYGSVLYAELSGDGEGTSPDLKKSLALGVVAAALVPVLLGIAALGSDAGLVGRVLGAVSDEPRAPAAVLYFSFCVAAGITSRAVIRTVRDRWLQEEIEALSDEVSDLAETVESNEEPPEEADIDLPEEPARVLEAMAKTGYRRPSPEAIAEHVPLDAGRVRENLGELARFGLVEQRTPGPDGRERWRIRKWGRQHLQQKGPETPRTDDQPSS